MKLTKFDIGGEIISILTKGMYPNPLDALREYVQNAVDANANNVSIRIKQSLAIIEDDGIGMNNITLRKALRLGVSDKNPAEDVGFMGIGIYSAFHLCDQLHIYSRMENNSPYLLIIDFKGMKKVLEEEKKLRLQESLSSDELTDLQTILQKNLTLKELTSNEFPKTGTWIELKGLVSHFKDILSNFNTVQNYLGQTIPLHFNKENFKYAEEIETKIIEIADKNNSHFELVNLSLNVNGKTKALYRPYSNDDFANNAPQKPKFIELKDGKEFLGVAWGCLNGTRYKIKDKELRGFLLKKQGFAIGKRSDMYAYFGKRRTHFDRYIGEFIVMHPQILPSAARTDLAYSPLRAQFYNQVTSAASELQKISNDFWELDKAEELVLEVNQDLKKLNANFSPLENDTEILLSQIIEIEKIIKDIESIIRNKGKILNNKLGQVKNRKKEAIDLRTEIKGRINDLTNPHKKSKDTNNNAQKVKVKIAQSTTKNNMGHANIKYENLLELLSDLDFDLKDDIENIFAILDEKYIQAYSDNKNHYYTLLNELKNEIEENINN